MEFNEFKQKTSELSLSLSFSSISQLAKSEKHFVNYFCNNKETKPQALGTLAHCLVLQPEELSVKYAIKQHSGATKAGKEEAAQAAALGLQLITQAEFDTASDIAQAVLGHADAAALLRACTNFEEGSLFSIL